MKAAYAFNRFIEKWMPFVTPCSLLLGVFLSVWLKPAAFLVPWIFAFMTFSGSLGSGFKDLKKVLLHPAPLLVCLFILHVWMPLLSFGAGSLFFHGDAYTITGLALAFIIPTGIVSFMWVSLYQGNIALTLSIILLDTFLSPFVVPYTLHLLVGANVNIDTWGMMKGLLWMVVLPSLAGMALNHWTRGQVKSTWGPKLAPFSKLGLISVVSINASVVAPYFTTFSWKSVGIALTVLGVAATGYFWGWLASRRMKAELGVTVAMTFNSGMRNISAGTVLAATYFAPAVVFPVMVGTLFQQILASTYAYMLNRKYGLGPGAEKKEAPGVPLSEGRRAAG
ncbi:bile acid:sodium symporter family protein [Gorillibacterium sp. sgz5001074]|uniref:bile acid:sodium symporter family protein n=1 Tax=Gorillibacterium sp. sgz5001074 TaxID=3446695 RepID=UPI003F663043